jgi:pyruvate,water dikinase
MERGKGFPMPREVQVPPELEGWEEMYYPAALFQEEREEYDNKFFWVRDMLHSPYPIYPFDQIVPEAWTELIGH